MSSFTTDNNEEEILRTYCNSNPLDTDDLTSIHDLRRVDRPALSSRSDLHSSDDNIYSRLDLPEWRGHSLSDTGIWEPLKSKLLSPPARTPPVYDADVDGKVFEAANVPAVIRGAMDTWGAMSEGGRWTFQSFLERFGETMFRFSDTHGAMMSFGTYVGYCHDPMLGVADDSPLAVYDSEFGDDEPTRVLLEEYEVPGCFSDDLFGYVKGDKPPYRWILLGPTRSGTGLHIDPLYTNAWVALISGCKRWMLFPPKTDAERIGVKEGKPQVSSSIWFKEYYDLVTGVDWPEEWKPYEVIQRPGECVFVPNGWFHLVLNLETSVAVTHNYSCEHGPFERMWEDVKENEPDFAMRWREALSTKRPDLSERIDSHEASGVKTEGYNSQLGYKTN